MSKTHQSLILPLVAPILLVALAAPAAAQSSDLRRASGDTWRASGALLDTSFQLSADVVLTVGEPVADIVIAVARGTGLILADGAVMSMDVATAGLQLANRPLAFSADALSPPPDAGVPQVIQRVTLMTAGDALALMQAVESRDGITDQVRQLLLDLDLEPDRLTGSLVVREGLDRFREETENLVFAIETDDLLVLVGVEELESAARATELPD